MKMRHSKARCERCKRRINLGASAIRLYGRLWHTNCAIAWRRQRVAVRGPREGAPAVDRGTRQETLVD